MERYPRLTKAGLVERLRSHARAHGEVSILSLQEHDRIALRSIPLHFPGIAAARMAAGVAGPAYKKPKRKTGPKPSSVFGRRPPIWSKKRVLDELRALDRAGCRTALAHLIASGHATLAHAAATYAGGLRAARVLAGIAPSPRRTSKRWWNEARILAAIRRRKRERKGLASTVAPPKLVTAGRWHFGSWSKALEAAGVDPATTRLPRGMTKAEIVARIRRLAAEGSDLKAVGLAKRMKLDAVRREFGTLHAAIIAAGFSERLKTRRHGGQIWNRDRVIAVLRERARRKEYTLTSGLHRVVQLYFGGAEEARRVAGVPSPVDVRIERRRIEEARRYTPTRSSRLKRSRRSG